MQCARAIPVTWLGSGSCQARPSRLNTNEWIFVRGKSQRSRVVRQRDCVFESRRGRGCLSLVNVVHWACRGLCDRPNLRLGVILIVCFCVIECDQKQQLPSTTAMSKQKRSDCKQNICRRWWWRRWWWWWKSGKGGHAVDSYSLTDGNFVTV